MANDSFDVGYWMLNVRCFGWRRARTAPDHANPKQKFTVTHPFHPWRGRQFELIDCQRRWGQWRVFYLTEDKQLAYFPASWTDAGPKDPFVEQAQGRALTRMEDLLRLAERVAEHVKEISPPV